MFAKLAYVLSGTFIEEIPDLLESATAPDDKGKSVFEVDHTMKELAENTQKNFTTAILVDSEIVLSTRYGKTRVFINKTLINRDHLSTSPYHQRPLINKV
jgi:hypothetical protein